MVMLHIRSKGITNAAIVANILPADGRPDPGDEVNRSNSFFSEHGHVAYQIKGNH